MVGKTWITTNAISFIYFYLIFYIHLIILLEFFFSFFFVIIIFGDDYTLSYLFIS